jgi:hypothetical protein
MKTSILSWAVALLAVNAVASTARPVRCDRPDPGPLSFARVTELIDACGLTTIEGLLPLLPDEYRERYTLIHSSRSLQGASPEFPRVIAFGRSAELTLAFNGDPDDVGHEFLETAEFDRTTRRFVYREIHFGGGRPQASAANPPLCLGCHRADPRPNWDGYLLWPGAFGAEDDRMFYKTGETDPSLYPADKALLRRYLTNAGTGRYKHLVEFKGYSQAPEPTPHFPDGGLDYFASGRHNLGLTVALGALNAERLARKIAETPAARPYRYALLAALSCGRTQVPDELADLASYLPAEVASSFPESWAATHARIKTFVRKSLVERTERHLLTLGIARPEDARVTQYYDNPEMTYDGVKRVHLGGVAYLAQGIGLDVTDWSMEFGEAGAPTFSMHVARGAVSGLEEILWKSALDPAAEADLFGIYARAVERGIESYSLPFADDAELFALCRTLREKSLAALSR